MTHDQYPTLTLTLNYTNHDPDNCVVALDTFVNDVSALPVDAFTIDHLNHLLTTSPASDLTARMFRAVMINVSYNADTLNVTLTARAV